MGAFSGVKATELPSKDAEDRGIKGFGVNLC